jgi:hypothetical protein
MIKIAMSGDKTTPKNAI